MNDNFDIITVRAIARIIMEFTDDAYNAMNEARNDWYDAEPDSKAERFYYIETQIQAHTHDVLEEIGTLLDTIIRAEELRIKYMN